MNDVTRYNVHDKVQKIFDVLETEHGILARTNFSCCTGCSCSEMGSLLDKSDEHWGAVYYHKQSGEGFEQTGECLVGFLTFDGKGASDVAAKACEVFEAHGLEVDWSGNTGHKISISIPGYDGDGFRY